MKKFKKVAITGIGLIEIIATKTWLRRIVAFMLVAIVFTLMDGHSLSKVEASQLSIASDIYTSEPEITLTIPETTISLEESYSSLESNPDSHLLSVGLNQDGEAVVCSIDEDTGEDLVTYKLTKRIEDNDIVITDAEPLDIAADSSAQVFWVSFDDLTIRKYDKFAAFLSEQTVSHRPDGLELIGNELQYCSSITNKVYRISSNGEETDLGVVSSRLSVDGVATDSLSVNYTTQEYEGYNPRAISGNYLCSAKISKRDTSIGQNFVQTIPDGTPIWTNEQDTPAPCAGMTEATDSSVPEGHVVYLSCTDGNVYKCRFENKVATSPSSARIRMISYFDTDSYYENLVYVGSAGRTQHTPMGPGAGEYVYGTHRSYYQVVGSPSSYIEARVVGKARFSRGFVNVVNVGQFTSPSNEPISTLSIRICTFNPSWNTKEAFNNPVLGSQLISFSYDGAGEIVHETSPGVRVASISGFFPDPLYLTYRYGNAGQTYSNVATYTEYVSGAWVALGRHIVSGSGYDSFPIYLAFLTNNGSLTVLDQFTSPIPVPQGLAFGVLEPKVKEFLIRDVANHWNLIKHTPAKNRYDDHRGDPLTPERQQVIVASDTSGKAKVNLEVVTDPVGVEDKMAWRAEPDVSPSSAQIIPQSGSFNDSGKSEATISSTGIGEETYEFYVGFDSNRNGLLDAEEETMSVNKVLLLTKSYVENNFDIALDAARLADLSGLLDMSSTNILIFLGKPDEANIQSEIKPSTVKRDEDDKIAILLEHPVGADFSSTTGIANIDLRKFDPDSKTADRIETSVALGKAIKDELDVRKDYILNFFAQPNSPPYHVFQFTQIGVRVVFESEDDLDLQNGIGKAKLSYELKVHVRKVGQEFIIEKLFVDGLVEDLYDWDFYFGPREDKIMATIQFAWRSPPGNNAGRIFRTEVKFKTSFENFPFPE